MDYRRRARDRADGGDRNLVPSISGAEYGSAHERYVDSPLDKRASTSASLHVRSLACPSAEPPSDWETTSRVGIVLRACCFFVDVSGDIMASLVVILLISILINRLHAELGLIDIFSISFRPVRHNGVPTSRRHVHCLA
jgi:hypothetical protein